MATDCKCKGTGIITKAGAGNSFIKEDCPTHGPAMRERERQERAAQYEREQNPPMTPEQIKNFRMVLASTAIGPLAIIMSDEDIVNYRNRLSSNLRAMAFQEALEEYSRTGKIPKR